MDGRHHLPWSRPLLARGVVQPDERRRQYRHGAVHLVTHPVGIQGKRRLPSWATRYRASLQGLHQRCRSERRLFPVLGDQPAVQRLPGLRGGWDLDAYGGWRDQEVRDDVDARREQHGCLRPRGGSFARPPTLLYSNPNAIGMGHHGAGWLGKRYPDAYRQLSQGSAGVDPRDPEAHGRAEHQLDDHAGAPRSPRFGQLSDGGDPDGQCSGPVLYSGGPTAGGVRPGHLRRGSVVAHCRSGPENPSATGRSGGSTSAPVRETPVRCGRRARPSPTRPTGSRSP